VDFAHYFSQELRAHFEKQNATRNAEGDAPDAADEEHAAAHAEVALQVERGPWQDILVNEQKNPRVPTKGCYFSGTEMVLNRKTCFCGAQKQLN
jgi:hypothetical protein